MNASVDRLWDACCTAIRREVPPMTFRLWIEPLQPVGFEDSAGSAQLRVAAPSPFHIEMVQNRLQKPLQNGLRAASDTPLDVAFIVIEEENEVLEENNEQAVPEQAPPEQIVPADRSPAPDPATPSPVSTRRCERSESERVANGSEVDRRRPGTDQRRTRNDDTERVAGGDSIDAPSRAAPRRGAQAPGKASGPAQEPVGVPQQPAVRHERSRAHSASTVGRFRPAYTFDQFIEGDCNQLARSAALAIANNPNGTKYNPFLVYGGVGLGKTHLAQAIGNRIYGDEAGRAVVYVSSEQFTSQFVRSIQNNSVADFTAFYRQIDVLIVDDVQFFSGKEKTQEEFFHVFNTLHQDGKQIVLCADRPPRSIDGIEERLLSRFQWGLSADVQKPDFETRLAILQSKAELIGLAPPPALLDYIAHNVQDSIRNLEGALARLKAHIGLTGDDLTLLNAKPVLRDIVTERTAHVDVSDIMELVASYYRLDENALPGRSRKQEIVKARQLAMYFARHLTEKSLGSIGDHFGGRDHSTVIHSIKAVEDRLDTEAGFRHEHDDVERALRSQGAAV
jgi:chromosomal replication initiator protein